MTTTKKEQRGYLPPTSELTEFYIENAVLMTSAATEDVNEFEIGYDD